MDDGNMSLTVHDIQDHEAFVSSGITMCTQGGGAVTIRTVAPSGDHHGLVVSDFDTFVADPKDQSVPLSLRGRLREVTARRGDRAVDSACSGRAASTERTYLGWEMSGTEDGPARAQKFEVTYEDEDGHLAKVDLNVAIVLCTSAETTGACGR
jgi:hypothetical protein